MRGAARDDGALTEVGCSPPATAACKLKSNPGSGQDRNRGRPDEYEPTVHDRDSGRHDDSRPSSACQEKDSSRITSASSPAMGTGQRAAYGQGAAECEHAETNARAGEAKVASRGGCQDLEDHSARRVCNAGWQLSNRRWAVYLPQQCNLGTPSRSAHGPNYSACRQRSHGYLRQRVCAHS